MMRVRARVAGALSMSARCTRCHLCALCLLCVLCVSACAPPRPSLPTGAGSPFPGFDAAYDEAVSDCRSARTLLAELGLSGRSGGQRLRGSISAGIEAPSAIRLEGVALGRPIFILASRAGDATLLLVRENRVVRGAPPDAIIEALTGIKLAPSELLAIVAGCGLGVTAAFNGRTFSDDWAAADTADGTTYLRRFDGRWRVGAAVRGELQVSYGEYASGLPSTVHVRAGKVADMTLRVSQLEINTTIDDKAFEIDLPPDAIPLTIEELRREGPLGDGLGT